MKTPNKSNMEQVKDSEPLGRRNLDMVVLYKYFSNDSKHALKNLENGIISFSPLELLNDPFDGVGVYLYQVSEEEKEYWNSIGSDLPKLLSIRCSERIREMLNFNYRVFCSTKEFNNPLMWAYYANSHQGFCVGYAKDNIVSLSDITRDIVYQNEMYPINDPDENTFLELLFRKSIEWQRENEHRALYKLKKEDVSFLPAYEYLGEHQESKIYILHGGAQQNDLQTLSSDKIILKPCKPTVIYIGLRTPIEIKKKLVEIAKKHCIPIYQMIQEQSSFHLAHEKVIY